MEKAGAARRLALVDSRESGNPQPSGVILAKAGTSTPRETKKESRATNPFSHVAPRRFFAVIPAKAGIQTADAGVVWERGRPARKAALARGDTLILAFSHEGLTGVGFEIRLSGEGWSA